MARKKKYKINEIFYSLQGEGFFTGTPMVFIRFSGCNRKCPFCDTDFADFTAMTAAEIAAEASKYPAERIVLTGGEPLLQLDDALTDALVATGKLLHIETNGSLPGPPRITWVTCSPKSGRIKIDPEDVDELKLVYQGQDQKFFDKMMRTYCQAMLFLQPCSCQNTAETVDYVMNHPQWRLSLQTHKLISIK